MGRVQVYYDGGCPLCSREIAFYRGRTDPTRVDWIDVNDGAAPLTCDLDRSQALARMHARRADGTLVSGAAAFGVIWRETPGFRWLGRLVALPPVGLAAEFSYRLFLRVRPLWR